MIISETSFPEKNTEKYFTVNPFTVGNPLFWENFLLPECLRDSIV